MFRALQYIILLITVVMTGFYVNMYQPELVEKMLTKFDVFGVSKAGKDEQERLAKIQKLELSYAEKQVLINKTVFMKATTEMAKLALGDPKKDTYVYSEGSDKVIRVYYIYYLEEDKRPTVLVFDPTDKIDKDGNAVFELVNAYKGSTLDYSKVTSDISAGAATAPAPQAPAVTPATATPLQPPAQPGPAQR